MKKKKVKKNKDITPTSVAFKTEKLNALKGHPLHKDKKLSISWILNQLLDKFLSGEITIGYP